MRRRFMSVLIVFSLIISSFLSYGVSLAKTDDSNDVEYNPTEYITPVDDIDYEGDNGSVVNGAYSLSVDSINEIHDEHVLEDACVKYEQADTENLSSGNRFNFAVSSMSVGTNSYSRDDIVDALGSALSNSVDKYISQKSAAQNGGITFVDGTYTGDNLTGSNSIADTSNNYNSLLSTIAGTTLTTDRSDLGAKICNALNGSGNRNGRPEGIHKCDMKSLLFFKITDTNVLAKLESAVTDNDLLFYIEQAISKYPKLGALYTCSYSVSLRSNGNLVGLIIVIPSPISRSAFDSTISEHCNYIDTVANDLKSKYDAGKMSLLDVYMAAHENVGTKAEYGTSYNWGANDIRGTNYCNGTRMLDHCPVGCTVDGLCVCQAYAAVFNTIVYKVLDEGKSTHHCWVVDSTSHAWNLVKDEYGDYYYVDVTWDDDTSTDNNILYHVYFMVPYSDSDTNTLFDTGSWSSVHVLNSTYVSKFSEFDPSTMMGSRYKDFVFKPYGSQRAGASYRLYWANRHWYIQHVTSSEPCLYSMRFDLSNPDSYRNYRFEYQIPAGSKTIEDDYIGTYVYFVSFSGIDGLFFSDSCGIKRFYFNADRTHPDISTAHRWTAQDYPWYKPTYATGDKWYGIDKDFVDAGSHCVHRVENLSDWQEFGHNYMDEIRAKGDNSSKRDYDYIANGEVATPTPTPTAAPVYCDITYTSDVEGVTGMPNPLSVSVTKGSTLVLPSAPFKSGYNFEAWIVNGYSYQPGETFTVNGDTTISAKFTKATIPTATPTSTPTSTTAPTVAPSNYTVTYSADVAGVSGMPSPSSVTVSKGSSLVLPAAPSKVGYRFLYWIVNNGSVYNPGETIPAVNSNLTIQAHFVVQTTPTATPTSTPTQTTAPISTPTPTPTPTVAPLNYTVTYLADVIGVSGMPSPSSVTVSKGSSLVLPAAPSKVGYRFLYWIVNNGSVYNPGDRIPVVNSNLTIQAHFVVQTTPTATPTSTVRPTTAPVVTPVVTVRPTVAPTTKPFNIGDYKAKISRLANVVNSRGQYRHMMYIGFDTNGPAYLSYLRDKSNLSYGSSINYYLEISRYSNFSEYKNAKLGGTKSDLALKGISRFDSSATLLVGGLSPGTRYYVRCRISYMNPNDNKIHYGYWSTPHYITIK